MNRSDIIAFTGLVAFFVFDVLVMRFYLRPHPLHETAPVAHQVQQVVVTTQLEKDLEAISVLTQPSPIHDAAYIPSDPFAAQVAANILTDIDPSGKLVSPDAVLDYGLKRALLNPREKLQLEALIKQDGHVFYCKDIPAYVDDYGFSLWQNGHQTLSVPLTDGNLATHSDDNALPK